MAGDWIKIEHVTPDKPEVHRMAESLKIDPDAVVGKLLRLWIWADQQIDNCNGASVTLSLLDRITFVSGFAMAMHSVGWLVIKDGEISFPNFERHNGKTAKDRANTNRRVSKSRDVKRNCNADTVTESEQKPLPEKRREEKRINTETPLPPFDSERFRQAWSEWEKSRREIGKPLKPTAIRLQYADLSKLGEERAIAALLHSAKNGYQGIYEPKGGEHKPQQSDRFSANINAAADAIKNMQSREEKPP